jgi:PIN domain nuclease of toxin-antitoxin system
VTGFLLDTNAALIALTDPGELRSRVRAAILAGPNVLSAVVYWEVLLKKYEGRAENRGSTSVVGGRARTTGCHTISPPAVSLKPYLCRIKP